MSFLVNRYFALLGNIYALCIDFMPISDESCPKFLLFRELFVFFQQFIVCVILIIRTYALYNCSKRLLAWITIIFLVLAGGSFAVCFGHHTSDETISLGVGCYDTYTAEAEFQVTQLNVMTLSICRFWRGVASFICLRIIDLCPHSSQDF